MAHLPQLILLPGSTIIPIYYGKIIQMFQTNQPDPMFFLWFSYGFPIILWFSYVFYQEL